MTWEKNGNSNLESEKQLHAGIGTMEVSLAWIRLQQNEFSEAEDDASGRSRFGKVDAVHTVIVIYSVRKYEKCYTLQMQEDAKKIVIS